MATWSREFMNAPRTSAALRRLGLSLGVSFSLALCGQTLQAGALHYLTAGKPDFVELLAPPPAPNSAEQAADMATVVAVAHACSTNDAVLAFGEKKFSIFRFAPAVGESLQRGKLPKTEALFEHVQEDAAAVTDKAKDHWRRPRPYTLNPTLASGKLEKSFSYPSGHGTEGMVLALVLTELFPDRREAILKIGCDLGWHRVWIGRHYPTDIYAGRVLAQAIVREMKASPDFQHDVAEAKAEIAATIGVKVKDRRVAYGGDQE